MGERYWEKPTGQIRLFGDKKLAQTHIKRARVYVGLLMSQTSKLRPMRFHQWEESDGTMIWVQVWNDLLGQRAIMEITSGSTEALVFFGFYLESDFIEPSQVLTTYLTFGSKTVSDVKDAVFWHGDRSEEWSNVDPDSIGFYNHPTGTELVAMTQPLSLGYDKPTADLTYTEALLRYEKCTAYFGTAYTYDDSLTQGLGSGSSTGKMVLYHRAKLGAKLDSVTADLATQETLDLETAVDRYQQERFTNYPTQPGQRIGWHTCYGLHTDARGDYWIVHIDASAIATFTKLFIWPAYRSAIGNTARNTDERLFVEAYALGYSQLTDTVVTCDITHDCPHQIDEYRPCAYSWHFNWSGDTAILVGHRMAGWEETNRLDKHHLDTRVLVMSLEIGQDVSGDYVASCSVTTQETAQWQRITDYQSDTIWIPRRLGGGLVNMTLFSPPYHQSTARYPAPEQVPVYAYFYSADGRIENNDQFIVRYTRIRETIDEIEECWYTLSGYAFCVDEPVTGSGERFAGTRQKIGYYTPIKSCEIETEYGSYGKKWASASNTGETNTVTNVGGGSFLLISEGTFDECGCGPAITHAISAASGDNYVSYKADTVYWQPTIVRHSYQRSVGIPAIGLVIPADCAEGCVIASSHNQSVTYVITTYVDSATLSRKYTRYYEFVSKPSESPIGGDYITPYGEADLNPDLGGSLTTESYPERWRDGATIAIGRYGVVLDESDSQKADGTAFPDISVSEYGYAEISMSNDLTGWVISDAPGLYLTQAFGGEAFLRGSNKQALAGFPAEFETLDYTPEVIGSI